MNKIRDGTIKWYSVVEIIDVETGEIISKSEYERRNLKIIKKTKSYDINDGRTSGTIKHTWECRENEQCRLFN